MVAFRRPPAAERSEAQQGDGAGDEDGEAAQEGGGDEGAGAHPPMFAHQRAGPRTDVWAHHPSGVHPPGLHTYTITLAVLGAAIILAAPLRRVLGPMPLSLPILYLLVGMGLFALPFGIEGPRLGADDEIAERVTEFVVIVSLMGAGLKLERPVGWRSWQTTWRLLGVTMPLTIVAVVLLGVGPLGLSLASAVLLGAVLAPTDPVLASDVQVEGPTTAEDSSGEDPAAEDAHDEVRFALTSEAGLNDALAFPFTNLAIAMAAGGAWFTGWVVEDVVVRLSVGLVAGWVLGRGIAWLAFRFRSSHALARTSDGFVAIGATLFVYGVAELAHGYGFLAVFVAAVTIRNRERSHEYHQILHDYADSTERLASIAFLLLLGGALVDGGLSGLTVTGAVVAVAIVFLVRPLTGMIGLIGTRADAGERAAIAFFGVRGMGSIYYLAHAATEERFPLAAQVWAVALLVIVISIVVHGVSATAVLDRLDRRRRRRGGRPESGSGLPEPAG
jgi:sodium/hydrogen antiporter